MNEEHIRQSFSGMTNKFDCDFEMEQPVVEIVDTETKEVVPYEASNDDAILPDADYITSELKMTVESISTIMDQLGEDLRIGSPPRMYEVYAKLAETKISAIDKLTGKSKIQMDAKMKKAGRTGLSNVQSGNTTTNNIAVLTSKDLLKMLSANDPKPNSSVKGVSDEEL